MQSDIKSYERTLKRMNQYDNNSKDPIERVKGRIEAICLQTEIYDYENIQELIDLYDNIDNNKKQYINPTAFIFGFFVITNKKIDKKKINELKKYNNILVDNDVELVDIIRYARFWLFTVLNIEEGSKHDKKSESEEIQYIGGDEEYKESEEEEFEEYNDDEW
jgi:hypothetical protein